MLHGQFLANLPILVFRVVFGPRYVDAESPMDDSLLLYRSLHQNPAVWGLLESMFTASSSLQERRSGWGSLKPHQQTI